MRESPIKAVAFVIGVCTLLFMVELAANQMIVRPVYDRTQSGFVHGHEGGGAGGGSVQGFQTMPSWWWRLYNWLYVRPTPGPLGGGGGGGF
jgi:hypothetical protein